MIRGWPHPAPGASGGSIRSCGIVVPPYGGETLIATTGGAYAYTPVATIQAAA